MARYRYKKQNPNDKVIINSYYEKYEHLLHDMFLSADWIERNGRQKMLRVLTYCLYYHSITADQLLSTSITPGGDRASEKGFLNRLVRTRYMSSEQIDIPGMKCILYTITNTGISCCIKKLRIILKEDKKRNIDYGIDEQCLQWLSSVAKISPSKTTRNYSHFIGVRTLYTYCLSSMPSPAFSYQLEVGIDQQGNLYSTTERAGGDIEREMYSFQCDALLSFPLTAAGKKIFYYVEQDTGSQRAGVIQNKISNYLNSIYANNQKEPFYHCVLFSLLTKPSKISYKSEDESENNITCACYRYAKTIAYIVYCLSDGPEDFMNVPMSYVYDELIEYVDNAPVAKDYYSNAASFVKHLLTDEPDMTAERFYEITRQGERTRNSKINDGLVKRHRQTYLSRRSTIQKAVISSSPMIMRACLSGFSICTTHSGWHENIMPYLLPFSQNGREERLILLLSFYEYIKTTISHTYEPVSDTFSGSGFVLKNHYTFDNGFHAYIENISDDISGKIRVEKYLNSITWTGGKGVLICLISEDDVAAARKLYMETSYEKQLHGNHSVTAALPLEVYFLKYDSLERGRDLFDFTSDGTFHLKPYPQ